MTRKMEIDLAQSQLSELIAGLGPDDELILTKDDKPIARLLPATWGTPVFGRCKGMLTVVAEDDDHLEDFKEYMS